MHRSSVRTPRGSRAKRKNTQGLNFREKILMGFVFFLFVWVTIGPFGLWRLHRLKAERDNLIAQHVQFAKQNQLLQEKIRLLKEDEKAQEELVRSELGWVRDNELLYVFHNER